MKKITIIICTLANMLIGSLQTNAQWQRTNGTNRGEADCLAIAGTDIFVGTISGGVFLSTDTGFTWTPIHNGLTNTIVESLAISGTNIFAGTEMGAFLSTDTGSSWKPVNNGMPITQIAALALMGTNVFAGTTIHGIFSTTDTGKNWIPDTNGLGNRTVISLAVSGTNIFAGTEFDGVYLSIDSGKSWKADTSGFADSWVTSIVASGMNIIAGTANGYIFQSTNNGANWLAVDSGLGFVNCLVIRGTNIFAGTGDNYYNADGNVFLSTNNGTSWMAVNKGLTDTSIFSLAINSTAIFAGDGNGTVWKRSLSDILGVENISANENNISIYPNPATNQLTIHISASTNKWQKATVSIVNVLGQQVLSNSPLLGRGVGGEALGWTINVSSLPSGIYFVRVANESGSWVGKFVKE